MLRLTLIAAALMALAAPAAALMALAAPAAAQSPGDTLPAEAYVQDFDVLWEAVRDRYAYMPDRRTDWNRVRDTLRPRAAGVRGRREFIGLLEEMIRELYDAHAHLAVNTARSPRLVPSGTDLWAEWREGVPLVTAVRAGSEAERAGFRAGMRVLAVDGVPVADAVRARGPTSLRRPDPVADDWALRSVLAGTASSPVRVRARGSNGVLDTAFTPGVRPRTGPLTFQERADGIGYVRVHDSLGEGGLVAAFDSALLALRGTRGLILDLRDTPGGGNSTVARGILGRLTEREQPYQRHELPWDDRANGIRRVWVELVAPRGPFAYRKPVVVLVGPWTGSMGEGMAIGMDAMGHNVVGSRMAGLLGAVYDIRLPRTGFVARIPAERLFHVNGTPRERFIPPVSLDPAAAESPAAVDAAVRMIHDRTLARTP